MMDGASKYLLTGAGGASLPGHVPPLFVPPPARLLSLPTTDDAAAASVWKGPVPNRSSFPSRSSFPNRSLVSSWLSFDRRDEKPQQQRSANTKSLHAPLERFEAPPSAAAAAAVARTTTEQGRTAAAATAAAVPRHFGKEHGLLCLERAIPEEVLRGLRLLTGTAAPFKAETLHSWAEGEGWLDILTDPLFFGASSDIPPCPKSLSQKNGLQEEEQEGEDAGGGRRADLRRKRLSSPNNEAGGGELLVVQDSENSMEALRWLKADVQRIARIFAREVSSDAGCGGWFKAGKEEGKRMDVTVKLELLRKGKCPRFHLDKVPLRLICTYAGPTTEWLDGYDTWEMENNRSFPPACNEGISGGREARHARAGDVLIFRGQEEGQDAIGVAHRSPDMVEGQSRLVLTMDVGDIIAPSSAS